MLIRSQDKKNLIELQNTTLCIGQYPMYDSNTSISYCFNIETHDFVLGRYSSEEKVMKVLDMIEKEYSEPTYISKYNDNEYAKYEHKVFHMPADDKVKV